jgi:hypothetical protein
MDCQLLLKILISNNVRLLQTFALIVVILILVTHLLLKGILVTLNVLKVLIREWNNQKLLNKIEQTKPM